MSLLEWLESHRVEIREVDSNWIAFTPEDGLLGHGDDPKELYRKFPWAYIHWVGHEPELSI